MEASLISATKGAEGAEIDGGAAAEVPSKTRVHNVVNDGSRINNRVIKIKNCDPQECRHASQGFWNNEDIFDHDSEISLDRFVTKAPDIRLSLGLDHKQTLLNQAARLGFVDELLEHDCNQPLPAGKTFQTAYSNMLYWLNDPISAMHNIGRVLEPGGELVTVFPNSDFYKHCLSYVRKNSLWTLLNRGRADHIMWHMDIPEFEQKISAGGVFELKSATRYLSPSTLRIWDVGLRPISVPLIKMANALAPDTRREIKAEWCATFEKFAVPLLMEEIESGATAGGYNLVVLTKK